MPLKLREMAVVGLYYRSDYVKQIVKEYPNGGLLLIESEPTNKHDVNAQKVYVLDDDDSPEFMGYVNRFAAYQLRQFFEEESFNYQDTILVGIFNRWDDHLFTVSPIAAIFKNEAFEFTYFYKNEQSFKNEFKDLVVIKD